MRNILHIAVVLVLTVCSLMSYAQPAERSISRSEYIEMYKDIAIKEMLTYGIPASITLAQGILESGDGNSPLARYANNHFGIKCHKGWEGPTFIQDDDARNECFRKYRSPHQSFVDHSLFLKNRSRYAALFTLKTTDYKGWAHGLKKAGYATNPKYAYLLIKIIEDNQLAQYDSVSRMPSIDTKKHKAYKEDKQIVTRKETRQSRSKISENKVKYLIATRSTSAYKLAKEQDMGVWQILKYNDLDKNSSIKRGDVVYLQPKRNKAQQDFHVVQKGESMWRISQQYGIKLRKLYKKNNMVYGSAPYVGQKLSLNKKTRE